MLHCTKENGGAEKMHGENVYTKSPCSCKLDIRHQRLMSTVITTAWATRKSFVRISLCNHGRGWKYLLRVARPGFHGMKTWSFARANISLGLTNMCRCIYLNKAPRLVIEYCSCCLICRTHITSALNRQARKLTAPSMIGRVTKLCWTTN